MYIKVELQVQHFKVELKVQFFYYYFWIEKGKFRTTVTLYYCLQAHWGNFILLSDLETIITATESVGLSLIGGTASSDNLSR